MREENWCRILTLFCIPGSAAMVSKFGFASAQNVGTSESHDMFFPNSGIAHAAFVDYILLRWEMLYDEAGCRLPRVQPLYPTKTIVTEMWRSSVFRHAKLHPSFYLSTLQNVKRGQ